MTIRNGSGGATSVYPISIKSISWIRAMDRAGGPCRCACMLHVSNPVYLLR